MTKHCAEKQLVAFIDDELKETEYNLVVKHLKTCGRCASYVEEMKLVFDDLAQFKAPAENKELINDTMKLWEVYKHSDQIPDKHFDFSKLKKIHKIITLSTVAAGLAIGLSFGNMARQELFNEYNGIQTIPIVLQENDHSINDIYVSMMINDGQEDL